MHDASKNSSGASSIPVKKGKRREIEIAVRWETYRLADQNTGGGRINCVVVVRKIGETCVTGIDSAVVAITGAASTAWLLIPACTLAQIVQL
jgi:hypothetical protein